MCLYSHYKEHVHRAEIIILIVIIKMLMWHFESDVERLGGDVACRGRGAGGASALHDVRGFVESNQDLTNAPRRFLIGCWLQRCCVSLWLGCRAGLKPSGGVIYGSHMNYFARKEFDKRMPKNLHII